MSSLEKVPVKAVENYFADRDVAFIKGLECVHDFVAVCIPIRPPTLLLYMSELVR